MNVPITMPGHQIYEYLLVIDPHEALRHRIEKGRAHLTEKYNIQQPQTGRPHVSLVRFTAVKTTEGKLINRLRLIATAEKPFMVELQGFGTYPMHAIFIKIAN